MAEAFVNVTEGSGKKLHAFDRTIGANTVLDEIVSEGEQYLASYMVVSATTSAATANAHVLQIMAGASLKVRIRRIEVYQSVLITTAGLGNFQLFRLSSAGTGGTAITPAPLDTTDAASGATAMTLPTVKGTETTLVGQEYAYFLQTAAASLGTFGRLYTWEFDQPRSKPLIIAAGTANGIAIKTPGFAGVSVQCQVWLTESNF